LHPNWGTGRDEPTGNTKGVKKMRKITGNKKGIDTILAALLMVVIVVVAAVMVYAWSTGLLGTLLVNPNNNKEGPLTMDTYAFSNSTFVGITIRNAGSSNVTLTSFYVTDSNGNQWAKLTWAGGTIAPNKAAITYIGIGTANGCTYTGANGGFAQFTSGYSYTVKVVTAKNNPFTFTVTK
jgi:FlaG/FlaF family flagellin (archaellin)